MPNPPVIAVTVLGDDRPGIIAEVTQALAGIGGNLEDSTMTLLRGHFAMVVLVRTSASVEQVRTALEPVSADGRLTVDVRELAEVSPVTTSGQAWTLRVHGADRPGIVAGIARVVADHGGNIIDLGTRLGGDLYVLVADVELPEQADAEALRTALLDAAHQLGVGLHFDPVDDALL